VPPNYDRLRSQVPFQWYVVAGYNTMRELLGIGSHDYFLKPEAGVHLYRSGPALVRERYGERIRIAKPATPHISYGHISCLGMELRFPENGEVNYERPRLELPDVTELVSVPVDYERAGMVPFYLSYRRELQRAFPESSVAFTFGFEGPLTTAYELRGESVFTDPYDDPGQLRTCLGAIVDSIVDYRRFHCAVNGLSVVNPTSVCVYDDIASIFSPSLWPDFVTPAEEAFFRAATTGARHAHIEDLKPAHLGYLERLGIVQFDPSISHHLNPRIIRDECRVPFLWRLGSFHYRVLSAEDVRDFVYQAVADGASGVFSSIGAVNMDDESVPKVRAFLDAAEEVEMLLGRKTPREAIGEMVTPRGKARFWENWLDTYVEPPAE
jgi:hypothetical protein